SAHAPSATAAGSEGRGGFGGTARAAAPSGGGAPAGAGLAAGKTSPGWVIESVEARRARDPSTTEGRSNSTAGATPSKDGRRPGASARSRPATDRANLQHFAAPAPRAPGPADARRQRPDTKCQACTAAGAPLGSPPCRVPPSSS